MDEALVTIPPTPSAVEMNGNDALVTYSNASMLKVSDEEQKMLQAAVDSNEVEIRPDGLIYLPQVFVRDKLNRVFGIGQWALIQHGTPKDPERNKLYFDGSLYIRGCFAARAVGEGEYHVDNPMQSWASVYEAAKSDCLVRCCKDLGIAKELWMPAFGRNWQKQYAVKVWRSKAWNKKKKEYSGDWSWRRKDVEAYYDEKGGAEQTEPLHESRQPDNVHPIDTSTAPPPPATVNGASFPTFDPMAEEIQFGKFKGMKWGEIEPGYLEWLVKEGKRADVKEKAAATLRALQSVHDQKEPNNHDFVNEMFPEEPKEKVIAETIGAELFKSLFENIGKAPNIEYLTAKADEVIKKRDEGELTEQQVTMLHAAINVMQKKLEVPKKGAKK